MAKPDDSPAGDRLRVLYVGGLPRSGSTLTDLLLHNLPGHVGVGELFYLWRNCLVHDGLCSCGERFSACPFWDAVGDEAYGGWSTIEIDRVLALQARVDATAAIPLLISPRRSPSFQHALDEYTDLLAKLYAAIASVSGASVIVDSSKRPSMAFVLRTMSDRLDLRVAQVVRDPRGVAYSFSKHVALEPGVSIDDEMPRSKPRKVARRWVTVNAMIASLARFGVPLARIRYEDLVSEPRRELAKLFALEDEPVLPDSFDFVTPDGVHLPKTHAIASGRIRLTSGVVPLKLDEAWRSEMDDGPRRLVSAITAGTRRKYGYQ